MPWPKPDIGKIRTSRRLTHRLNPVMALSGKGELICRLLLYIRSNPRAVHSRHERARIEVKLLLA
jgi:hypothetical protein